jgi:hemerythrin-like domain-containing protein
MKRNENIVKLSRDHHASLLFCWKLRQGIKRHASWERMVKYVNYFWSHHFATHFKEEENLLFATLKDQTVQKAIDDHKKIKILINDLDSSEQKNIHQKLSQLADTVDEHVRYEERILFPHLESELTEDQLNDIGRQITPDTLLDNYEDDFWSKSKSL